MSGYFAIFRLSIQGSQYICNDIDVLSGKKNVVRGEQCDILFSGTGNSLYIAKNIAEHTGEKLISIANEMNKKYDCYEYTLNHDEVIGFVYPVYAWAPPKIVLQFIEKLKFSNYHGNYIFSVTTCGDNIGNTMNVMEDNLCKKDFSPEY